MTYLKENKKKGLKYLTTPHCPTFTHTHTPTDRIRWKQDRQTVLAVSLSLQSQHFPNDYRNPAATAAAAAAGFRPDICLKYMLEEQPRRWVTL